MAQKNIKAVVFDMDGVLVDSEIVYFQHEYTVLKKYRPWISEEDLYPTVGMSVKMYREYFHEHLHFEIDSDEYRQYSKEAFEDFKINYQDIMFADVKETLTRLKQMNYKLALASSSDLDNIQLVVKQCELEDYFDVICSGDMFEKSKPDPEIYLTTFARLAVEPEEALVIEDSPVGLQAAKASGAKAVAKRENRFGFVQDEADYYIDDLKEIIPILAKQIKVIFFDNDGTLTNFQSHLMPQSCTDALKQLKEKGVKLVMATGRSYPQLCEMEALDLSLFDGFICANGMWNILDGKVVGKHLFTKEQLLVLKNYLEENRVSCWFTGNNGNFTNLLDDKIVYMAHNIGSSVPPAADMSDFENQDITQVSASLNSEQGKELLALMGDVKSMRWSEYTIDIMPAGCGKDAGVLDVLRALDLDLRNAMAFGDGENDIPMLKLVPVGVAMGNSYETVKQNADYVTAGYDDEGIYKALSYFGLID